MSDKKKKLTQFIYPIPLLLLFLLGTLPGCQKKTIDESELAQADSTGRELPLVEVVTAEKRTFATQVISNGKLSSGHEAKLSFKNPGIIERILVRNGASVKSGQLLASLQNADLRLAVQQAELQLATSRIEINDLLITQGGKRGDTTSVASDVFAYIKLKSGYNRALLDLQKAKNDLETTYLRAPMDGTIANLTASTYNPTAGDKPFCSLLSRSEIVVRCPVLETELATVQPGQQVRVEPVGLNGASYTGRVTEINPMVNENGLVEVTIKVNAPDKRLLSGMNVRAVIEKSFPNALTIPKTAVVERSGRKVVFCYEDGTAKWHYVTPGLENATHITITEGLEAGERVIVSGNLNLGHDARVEEKIEDK